MKTFTILAVCLLLSAVTKAQSYTLPKLALVEHASGFDAPMDIAHCGDNRLFIAERLGKIWIIDPQGNKSAEPYLDITDKVFTVYPNGYDERGLLGFTFHPKYPDSAYVYVNYIGLDSNSHVSRFTVNPNNPNKAMAHSQLLLISAGQPKMEEYVNHKSGCIKFGPDGYLYTTFGDGGSGGDPLNTAQNPQILLGKMIRIDVDHPDVVNGRPYSVPSTNPYVNVDKFKDEIWATGLRNPWRWSFDSKTGALWLPDVGQDLWEEINVVKATDKGGRNFGWSCYEANHNYKFDGCDYNGTPYTFPIVEYSHSADEPCASITGGFVYRGTKFKNMKDKYIYCDYCSGKFSTVFRGNATWLNIFLTQSTQFAYISFGEAKNGELYVANTVDGKIYQLVDSSDESFVKPGIATLNNDIENLNIKLSPNPNKGQFNIEFTAAYNETYHISIKNVYGMEIIRETRFANKGFNRWSFASAQLKKNTYQLNIQTSKGSVSQKFVVE